AESRMAGAPAALVLDRVEAPLVRTTGNDMVRSPGDRAGPDPVTAGLVFVGYGLKDAALGIDDFAGLDLQGKIAIALTGAPASLDTETAAHLARTSKAIGAQAGGAIGLVQVRTLKEAARLPWDKMLPRAFQPRRALVGADGKPLGDGSALKVRATISDEAAAALFAGGAMDFAAVRAAAATGNTKGFALPGSVTITRSQTVATVTSPNVLALLPGSDPKLANEIVLISAHLDHVGMKANPKPGEDFIYNGAMDNAAGTTTLLEAATALVKKPPRRSVLFMATTAEESGLLGADYFARQPSLPMARIVAAVNIDMPLLTCDFGDIVAFGADRSTISGAVNAAAKAQRVSVSPDPQPEEAIFTRSDHYPLVRAGVPAVFLKTGWKDAKGGMTCKDAESRFRLNNYHEVSDQLDLPFDWAVAAKWTRLNIGIIRNLADARQKPLWYAGDYFGNAVAPGAPKAARPAR
uniref:M28 family metallopeptidase n=1 Tax=Sandarakinorhabdus sp. TaxID=1916663 RepID=UPI00286E0A83